MQLLESVGAPPKNEYSAKQKSVRSLFADHILAHEMRYKADGASRAEPLH